MEARLVVAMAVSPLCRLPTLRFYRTQSSLLGVYMISELALISFSFLFSSSGFHFQFITFLPYKRGSTEHFIIRRVGYSHQNNIRNQNRKAAKPDSFSFIFSPNY